MPPLTPSPIVDRLRSGSLRPGIVSMEGDVVSLGSGDPDFETPPLVVDAAIEALHDGWTHYGDLNGDPELRAEAALEASRVSGYTYGAEHVLITNGASSGAAAAMAAILSPGDKVLLPDPTYSLFSAAVHMAGAEAVYVPLDHAGHLDLDAIKDALPGCTALILVNPSNPSGAVFSKEELTQLAELTSAHGVIVIADEVCDRFVFDGRSFTSALAIDAWREQLIYCQSFSKSSAMTGWRVGYTVALRPLVDDIRLIHRNTLTSINAVAQRAALVALRARSPWADSMRDVLQDRRDFVVRGLQDVPGITVAVPEGGLFVFPRYNSLRPSLDVIKELAQAGVLARAGREFGPAGEFHIRLSLTAEKDVLGEGVRRIADYFTANHR